MWPHSVNQNGIWGAPRSVLNDKWHLAQFTNSQKSNSGFADKLDILRFKTLGETQPHPNMVSLCGCALIGRVAGTTWTHTAIQTTLVSYIFPSNFHPFLYILKLLWSCIYFHPFFYQIMPRCNCALNLSDSFFRSIWQQP